MERNPGYYRTPEWNARAREYNTRSRALGSTKWNETRRMQKKDWRQALAQMKVDAGCIDCGYNQDSFGLDFDHRPGEIKIRAVSQVDDFSSWDAVLEEAAKCDVRCVMCHRARTWPNAARVRKMSLREAIYGPVEIQSEDASFPSSADSPGEMADV